MQFVARNRPHTAGCRRPLTPRHAAVTGEVSNPCFRLQRGAPVHWILVIAAIDQPWGHYLTIQWRITLNQPLIDFNFTKVQTWIPQSACERMRGASSFARPPWSKHYGDLQDYEHGLGHLTTTHLKRMNGWLVETILMNMITEQWRKAWSISTGRYIPHSAKLHWRPLASECAYS